MATAETYPMFQMLYSCQKSILGMNPVLSNEKFQSLVLHRNAIMIQHQIIYFRLYYVSSGRGPLRGGCLQEVPNIVL